MKKYESPQAELERLRAENTQLQIQLNDKDAVLDRLQNPPYAQWIIAAAVAGSLFSTGLSAVFGAWFGM